MAEQQTTRPTLEDCQHELTRYIGAFSIMLSDIFGERNVTAMLKGDLSKHDIAGVLMNANLEDVSFLKLLPLAYDYAFHGAITQTGEVQFYDSLGYFERLDSFLNMFANNDWFDCVINDPILQQEAFKEGSIKLFVATGRARTFLDQDALLQARDIALLAGISERSIQNAFSARGAAQLKSEKLGTSSYVTAADARAWLSDKKGFAPTRVVDLEAEGPPPKALNSQTELLQFLTQRVTKKFTVTLVHFFNRMGMSLEVADEKASGKISIELSDALGIATALELPPKWLVTQILRINHPSEASLLLQS